MICGRGSDSHTISFYGRKAKILKEEEKLYDLKFYKQRVNSCPFFFKVGSQIGLQYYSNDTKKKIYLKADVKNAFWEMFFQNYID